MTLEELNANNKIGWNDGRVRLDGKTKIAPGTYVNDFETNLLHF